VHGPYTLTIQHRAENQFRRNSRRTVWCHSKECAIQTLAIAKYGLPPSRWPITLSQFRATDPLEGSDVRKPTSEVSDSTRLNPPLLEKMDLRDGNGVYERSERKGADAPKTTIDDLIRATDSVTEIQNTLRAGCDVRLE
jgi:hypothetical protein